jgi:hypothetical protein
MLTIEFNSQPAWAISLLFAIVSPFTFMEKGQSRQQPGGEVELKAAQPSFCLS